MALLNELNRAHAAANEELARVQDYLSRVDELRALANGEKRAEARLMLLRLAQSYDHMAGIAARLHAGH